MKHKTSKTPKTRTRVLVSGRYIYITKQKEEQKRRQTNETKKKHIPYHIYTYNLIYCRKAVIFSFNFSVQKETLKNNYTLHL